MTGTVTGDEVLVLTTETSRLESGVYRNATQFTLVLQPIALLSIASTPLGLAIIHSSDKSIVTATQPAQPGETLTAYASNLVPVAKQPPALRSRPLDVSYASVSLALPTTSAGPLPVGVIIGDVASEVLHAGSYQGGGDGYQINLRMPATG